MADIDESPENRTVPDVDHPALGPVPNPGDQIDDYRLQSVLGRGAMGVVFLAEEIGLERPVALKIIAPEYGADRDLTQRLLAEARVAAQLEHPNAVSIYRAGQADGHVFIAMQLVDGRSLADEIAANGPLAPTRAFALVSQIASALDAAHDLDVIHRDVTPANILLTGKGSDERAVLIDFGLSVAGQAERKRGGIAGTPAFLAPECTRGSPADRRSDIYSLACCAHAALTGSAPFSGTVDQVINAQRNESPPPLSRGAPTAPLGTDLIMARALSKLPADRFDSACEFTSGLGRLRDDVLVVASEADLPNVRELASGLRDRGLAARAVGLESAGDIAAMLPLSRSCVVAVGAGGLAPSAAPGLDAIGIGEESELITALLPGAPAPNDSRLLFLSGRPWIKIDEGLEDAADRLIAMLRSERGSRSTAVTQCPYRGLSAFSEDDVDVFVGREPETQRLVSQLEETGFVVVVGPSGSGKSSLIHAGLVPALRESADVSWSIASVTPGDDPLAALEVAATHLGRTVPAASMLSDSGALARAFTETERRSLLIVDQLEEVFSASDPEVSQAFLDNLAHAALVPGGGLTVVLGVRADFFPLCLTHPRLRGLLERCQLLLGPMTRHDLARVIEMPARAAGLTLEPGLATAVLDDVGRQTTPLPLLQFLLLELWRQRQGATLTLAAHAASGGVKGALSRRADEIYDTFDPSEREAAAELLLDLIRVDDSGLTTRRRVALPRVVTGERDQAVSDRVVDRLMTARLLTTARGTAGETLEITHESLINGWPRFRGWIDDRRDELHRRSRLQDAALDWRRSGRQRHLLYGRGRLAPWEDAEIRDLGEQEREFLEVSRGAESRAQKRRQRGRTAVGVAGVALALLMLAVFLLFLDRRSASREAEVAEAGRLAVAARAQLDQEPRDLNPDLAALLASESLRRNLRGGGAEPLREALELVGGQRRPLLPADTPPRVIATDGRRVLGAGGVGALAILASEDAASPTILTAGARTPGAIALLDDGRVAVGGAGGSLEIIDPEGRLPRRTLAGHRFNVEAVVAAPKGVLVSVDSRGVIIRWRPERAEPLLNRRMISGRARHLSISNDGQRMAVATAGGDVILTSVDETEDRVLSGHTGSVEWVSFSPDGGDVASAGTDGTIRQWSWETGEENRARRIEGHRTGATWVDWGADGASLVSIGADSRDSTLRVWDAASGELLRVLRTHRLGITAAALTPDRERLIAGLTDGSVRSWRIIAEDAGSDEVLGGRARVDLGPTTGGGRKVAVALVDGGVSVKAAPGKPWVDHDLDGEKVTALGFATPDLLLIGTDTGDVISLDTAQGVIVDRADAWDRAITDLAVAGDGRQVALGAAGVSTLILDRAPGGGLIPTAPILGSTTINALSLLPGGRGILTAAVDGAQLWERDGDTWIATAPLPLGGSPAFVTSVSPDGETLAVGGGPDTSVRIWDLSGDLPEAGPTLDQRPSGVTSITFAVDGQWIASSRSDGTITVSSTTTGETLRTFSTSGEQPRLAPRATGDGQLVALTDSGTVQSFSCRFCIEPLQLEKRAATLLGDFELEEGDLTAAGLLN